MQFKKYRALKIGIVIILAATIGGFVSAGNFVIPLVTFIVAATIIFFTNRKVDEIKNDERVAKIGDKAARWVLSILIISGALTSIVLMALGKNNEIYLAPAYIFSGIVWFSLIGYSVLFHFFNRRGE